MEKIEVWEDYYFDQDVLKKSEQTWNRLWIELAFTLCRKTETLIIFRAHTLIVHFFVWKKWQKLVWGKELKITWCDLINGRVAR